MGLFKKKNKDKSDDQVTFEKPEKGKQKPAKPIADKAKTVTYNVTEEDGHAAQYMAMIIEQTGRKRAMAFLSMSLIANLILLIACVCVFWWGILYKRDIYFMTTPDGRLQEMIPLTEPYVSQAGISNWVAQAVTETYSLDFRNYRKTLAKAHHFYSRNAWQELNIEIQPLIEQIVAQRLIIYAVADEAPRLLAEGVYQKGKYAWRLEFPMTLTHQLADRTITFKWLVTVLVGRAPIAEKPDGLEILQFIIKPR